MTVNTKYRLISCLLGCIMTIPVAKADLLKEGHDAFMNYDFELAREKYDKYALSLKKSGNPANEQLLDTYVRQLEIAENALENVQKIEIIDRIDVPAKDFFKYIKLPEAGGRILSPDVSILKKRHNLSDFAYSTENGDLMIWSENDDNGVESLLQSEKLMDGTWESPTKLGSVLNDGGDARNPFLLSDGLTLYFSANGEGSMGGYDLFVATKDPTSGEYRQPMGLGYPFNSPFNEYMMAIDEANGIGWWVTDRNRLDGQVSVYIFKTNNVRKNYLSEEVDDIVALARIDDISATQNPDTDYAAIIKEINKRSKAVVQSDSETDFIFPLPEGKVARKLSDFSSASARRNMQQYLEALKEHAELERKLTDLRKRYHATDIKLSSSTALKNQILELEGKREWQADRLKKMRNMVISAEINH